MPGNEANQGEKGWMAECQTVSDRIQLTTTLQDWY